MVYCCVSSLILCEVETDGNLMIYRYICLYIYVYISACVCLQGVQAANTLFARIHCVPLGFVSCHRNPYSESSLGFARSLAHPLSLPKPRLRDRLSLSKRAPKKKRRGEMKGITSLSEKSCAFRRMSIPPHYI